MIKEVGDGTFGNVWRAVHYQSGEIVSLPFFVLFTLFYCFVCCYIIMFELILGGNQENEEKVLLMGGMHKFERSEGIMLFFFKAMIH